jgi:hypothetical protein
MLIAIAQHTGECCRDDDDGYYTDSWRLDAGKVAIIDCAKDAVYWVPLPEQWQEANFIGMGVPISAVTADSPVFRHLCFQTSHSPTIPPTLSTPIYLKTDLEWQIQE